VPAPAAAGGLQLPGRGRAGPAIPVLQPRGVGRAGVLARVLQVSGAAWFRSGMQVGGPAGRGAGCCAAGGVGWLVLDFKHTFPAKCRLRSGGGRSARIPEGCGQGSRGRIECLATSAALRTGLCRRFRFRDDEPGLLPCPFGARPAGAVAADPGVGRSA
jgi:hypothetical protein